MPAFQDITIFSIDSDEVPLLGTVNSDGSINDPSFSTDPAHERPYLKPFADVGESSIDFVNGGSVIGQMNVEITDAPVDPEDQDSGIVTSLLASASGNSAFIGVRIVVREDGDVVFDGVISDVSMPKLTTYKLAIRDPRERERAVAAFTRATGTCVFPVVGPPEGFGFHTEYEEPLDDLFNDTVGTDLEDHTSDSGHVYTPDGATAAKISSDGRVYGTVAGVYATDISRADADYEIQFEVIRKSATAAKIGVVARGDGSSAQGIAGYYDDSTDSWTIDILGGAGVIGTFVDSLTLGRVYRCALRVFGESILLLVDGVVRVDTQDPTYGNPGVIGLYFGGVSSNTTGLHMDRLFIGDGHRTPGEPVLKRVKGVQAHYSAQTVFDTGAFLGAQGGGFKLISPITLTEEYEKLLREWGKLTAIDDVLNDAGSTIPTRRAFDVAIEWSLTGDPGTYTRVSGMIFGSFLNSVSHVFNIISVNGEQAVTAIALNVPDGDPTPDEGQLCYVRVVSDRPPTEDVPLYIEETFGRLTQKLYDGEYTQALTMTPVRYNKEAVRAMAKDTEIARGRITQSADDLRKWIEDNVYPIAGYAPAIENGEITPVKYELPDEDVELVQLDGSNSVSAEWAHGQDWIINQVIFKYEREIVPTTILPFAKPIVQKVIIERNRLEDDSQRRHGTKPLIFEPETLRSVFTEANSSSTVPINEIGALISRKRGEDFLRRFTNGAQAVRSVHDRSNTIDTLKKGDWVIGAWSWLPDYVSGMRGMNRLLQIWSIKQTARTREFMLLDAGPHDVPITQPTLGALVEEVSPVRVRIPVTAVGSGEAEVQYAFGEVEPDANSGQWITAGELDAPGNLYTLPFPPSDAKIWARARGVADGRRSSAWTSPINLRLSTQTLIRSVTVEIITDPADPDYGKPLVTWEPMSGTGGVKIKYQLHDQGTAVPAVLGSSIDRDADDLSAVLPVTLDQFEQVTIQVIGYPGFAAGAVAGAPGVGSQYQTTSRVESTVLITPSVTEDTTQDAGTGHLTLAITDPQRRVTKVEFRTRVGDAGVFSDWIEDTVAPYEANVALVDNETSIIEYRVSGLDGTGAEVEFIDVPVTFRDVIGTPSHVVIDLSPTQRQVTLSVKPTTAIIQWKLDAETDWHEIAGGSGVLPIIDVGSGDRVLWYRTKLPTGEFSETKRVVLDEDDIPEITTFILTEDEASKLRLVLGFDDDGVHYRMWARRNAWPTADGLETGDPRHQDLRYDGNVEITTLDWRASGNGDGTSTWYVIVRLYDEYGNYTQETGSLLVAGAPATDGALSNVRAVSNVEAGLRYNDILWDHNAVVQAGLHHVRILENGIEVVTARDARLEHDGATTSGIGSFHLQKPAYDTNGEFRTYNYTIELRRVSDDTLLATYTCSMSSWYAVGGGSGDPPDEIPDTPVVTLASSYVPRGTWTNTSTDWGIEIEWYTASAFGGVYSREGSFFLDPGVTHHDFPYPSPPWVKCRLRYYNGFGNGDWSDYSNELEATA